MRVAPILALLIAGVGRDVTAAGRHRIRVSQDGVAFLRSDGTVLKEIPLNWEKRGRRPVKDLPGIVPGQFESSAGGTLDVYSSWWARVSPGEAFVCLVVDEDLLWRGFHDRYPIASELIVLDANGREAWRKRVNRPGDSFFAGPMVTDNGAVVVGMSRELSKFNEIRAFDSQGSEVLTYPPAAAPHLGLDVKAVSPNGLYAGLEVAGSEEPVFLDMARKGGWETAERHCKILGISDDGLASLSCLKPDLSDWERLRVDIPARTISPVRR